MVTSADASRVNKLIRSDDASVFRAVNGIDLTLVGGEVYCLLGHNGAGKSTTISCLSGLVQPSAGQIVMKQGNAENTLCSNQSGKGTREDRLVCQQDTGLCLQDDLLWDDMLVKDHLELIGRLRGLDLSSKKNQEQNAELVAAAKLTDHMGKKTKELSGGWKRILSCCAAFVGDAQFVILDEPTSGVDPANRKLLWNFIRSKKREGKIILLTTHYMDEAEELADRVGIMAEGELKTEGSLDFLKSRFDCGYQLTLNFADKNTTEADLYNMFAGVEFSEVLDLKNGELQCRFRATEMALGLIADKLQALVHYGTVSKSVLTECSLEDVFLKVGEGYCDSY
jgi:ATP-binding cassette subfamily A (ABC1) protein 3